MFLDLPSELQIDQTDPPPLLICLTHIGFANASFATRRRHFLAVKASTSSALSLAMGGSGSLSETCI